MDVATQMAGHSGIVEAVGRPERRRSLVWSALIGVGLAVLAACAEKPPPPSPQQAAFEPPPPPLPAPRHHRVFPLPARKPAPPPENAAGGGDETTALAAIEPAAPPRTSQLIGLDQPAATRLLGAATEQADAPPATIWRYRNASCELDLFFYLDLRSGKMRTLHFAFKGDQGDREDCLRSLVVARRS
jgi:hypothetical protein